MTALRELLAQIIMAADESTLGSERRSPDFPDGGEPREGYLGHADAIIAAGWTLAAPPEEEEEPFSRMSYEAMEAKLAQQESASRAI